MSSAEPSGTSRRTVLCGLAAVFLAPAAIAAACSSDAESPAPSSERQTTSGPAAGVTLAALADIPVGQGKVVAASTGPVLLIRTAEAEVKAYNAACPHAGTTVGTPANGVITCPNHGSQFKASDGAVTKGPARSGLTPIPVRVANGQITTS